MLAVGLFAEIEPIEDLTQMRTGLFKGGGFYLLGIQLLACVVIIAWAAVTSFIILLVSVNIFMSPKLFFDSLFVHCIIL